MFKVRYVSLFFEFTILFTLIGNIQAITQTTFQTWGIESITQLRADFRLSGGLYANSLSERWPAYAWPEGIMFGSLVAAARVDSSYLSEAQTLANLVQTNYWRTCNGYSGYNASAGNCGDRYTDDNAWIALSLLELYEITDNTTYLTRAQNTIAFCMAFENGPTNIPNGGIRWHESSTCGAAVCSTAPTCLANLIIYEKTGIASYLTDGLRLYSWLTTSGVQASSGLYHQGIKCDGTINYGYRGYQTAVPLQAALRLYQITGENSYLVEAQRLAAAMETQFINSTTHALAEIGYWGGHDMTNAYVELYAVDKNMHWLNVVSNYLTYLHDNCKVSGRYPDAWDETDGTTSSELLANAAVARAYWKMASSVYITPYLSINGGALINTAWANLKVGDSIKLSPQPEGGTWNWNGPNGFSADTREINFSNINVSQAGTYTVTYTNSYGEQSLPLDYIITVSYWDLLLSDGFEAGTTLAINGWTATSGAKWLINSIEGNPGKYAWGGGSSTAKADLISGTISKSTGYVITGDEIFRLIFDVKQMTSLDFDGSILACLFYYDDSSTKVVLGSAEYHEDLFPAIGWYAKAGNIYIMPTSDSVGKALHVSFEGGPSSWNGASAQRLGIDNILIQKATLCQIADLSYDADVDVEDLMIFSQAWLSTLPDQAANIWLDDVVDMKDFLIISKCWSDHF